METPGRRYLCAGCRAPVLVCSHCDRGQRYCPRGCAERARRASVQAAGRRYQDGFQGRVQHAWRQRRYRARQQRVADLNAQADAWVAGPAGERRCPEDSALSVAESFAQERERLLPLLVLATGHFQGDKTHQVFGLHLCRTSVP